MRARAPLSPIQVHFEGEFVSAYAQTEAASDVTTLQTDTLSEIIWLSACRVGNTVGRREDRSAAAANITALLIEVRVHLMT